MRVAQVCSGYYPMFGGIETYVKEISERLVLMGLEIEVLATDPTGKLPKEEQLNGVMVRRFKSWAPEGNFNFSRNLRTYLRNNSSQYDLLHAHSYHDFPALYGCLEKSDNAFFFSPHYHRQGHSFCRNLLLKPYKYYGKKIFEKADKVVFVSNYEKTLALKDFKIDPNKTCIISPGIKQEEFTKIRKTKRSRLSKLLVVSRLEKYKGIQYIIKTLPNLPDVSLEVVGIGPFKSTLNEIAHDLHVENRVVFLQNVSRDQLLDRYRDADVFLLLSRHEAFGITVQEALACRTPCIVAEGSALDEWIDNKNCFGIKYPINNDQLVSIIRKSSYSNVKSVQVHDWNEVAKKLFSQYQACLN